MLVNHQYVLVLSTGIAKKLVRLAIPGTEYKLIIFTLMCVWLTEKRIQKLLKSSVKVVFGWIVQRSNLLIFTTQGSFEGLQWLWGMADSDGKDHHFGTYKKG